MTYILLVLFACSLVENVLTNATCYNLINKRKHTSTFRCSEITSLQVYLDKAKTNTTKIIIDNSNISNIAGHSFTRFGTTLQILDMHDSGIQVIEPQGFVALTNVEELILWGNKLTWVPVDWFVNMYNLKTLDLSFNRIQGIHYIVFQMLPLLENFYFDYNQIKTIDFSMFAYMTRLKKVKFAKNPWSWPYRARLTWQMENQNVDYSSEWEDWNWMNNVIKDCIETGQAEMPSDKVLDCAVGKLLEFTYDAVHSSHSEFPKDLACSRETIDLVSCMRPRNATENTDNWTVRLILENYATTLSTM